MYGSSWSAPDVFLSRLVNSLFDMLSGMPKLTSVLKKTLVSLSGAMSGLLMRKRWSACVYSSVAFPFAETRMPFRSSA